MVALLNNATPMRPGQNCVRQSQNKWHAHVAKYKNMVGGPGPLALH